MTVTPDLLSETPGAAALEDVLSLVHLSSAVFVRGEFSAPWAFASMGAQDYTRIFCPEADRLVLFHIVLEGTCRIRLHSGEEVAVSAGEAVVLPYSDRHVMGDPAASATPVPVGTLLPPLPCATMLVMRHGGGGPATRILCGYLHCNDLLFHPFLRALPPLIHVRPPPGPPAEWLRASAQYALSGGGERNGTIARLPELLLIDCLRQYVSSLPAARTGWLAALRDPIVGQALSALHQSPAESWTVTALARRVGVSRTILADRFTSTVGVPPMRYLLQWRLQLASHLLRSSRSAALAEIAGKVGYGSEAAFSRAFKRGVGQPPAEWRTSQRTTPGLASRPRGTPVRVAPSAAADPAG